MVGATHPGRDGADERRRLEEAAPARDADTAAPVLVQHLRLTAAALTDRAPCTRPDLERLLARAGTSSSAPQPDAGTRGPATSAGTEPLT